MTADIRLTILAALEDGPQTGYGLRQRIGQMFEPFFSASQGALYPAVGKCLAAGEIEEVFGEKGGKTASSLDKRRFSLTELGREALTKRVAALQGSESIRSEFLIAMTLANHLDEDGLLRLIDERIAEIHAHTRTTRGSAVNTNQFVKRYQQAMARAALDFLKGEGQAIIRAGLRDRTR